MFHSSLCQSIPSSPAAFIMVHTLICFATLCDWLKDWSPFKGVVQCKVFMWVILILAVRTLPTKHHENMDEVWWAILEFGPCRISLYIIMSHEPLQGGCVLIMAHPVPEWLNWFPSVWLHTLHELRITEMAVEMCLVHVQSERSTQILSLKVGFLCIYVCVCTCF